jgi:LmbE family N-acetylglucosaminyl deacetylase
LITNRLVGRTVLRLLPLLIPISLSAQLLEPPSTGGAVARASELKMLGHYERVLVIGAHPDDENTELLTVLVRGMGAEAAYLSLNRGEGGQNLIGPELGEALGLLRTSELLAARRLDGARQYFTRAYDFGYSKSLEDTWAHWPQDSVLKDVVRIVRRYRPQVIVTIFSGTPRDGHGQHQAAGWAAQEAFQIAGDSARFPELQGEEHLRPWRPLKLYLSTWFDSAATTLTMDGGALDPAVGQTYHQIAMRGRSLHRSQDMGQLQGIEPSQVRLRLLVDRTGKGGGGIFSGVDTTLASVLGAANAREYGQAVAALRGGGGAPALNRAVEALLHAPGMGADLAGAPVEVADQFRHLWRATLAEDGLLLDAIASDDRVTDGQQFTVAALAENGGREPQQLAADLFSPLARWERSDSTPGERTLAPGQLAAFRFTATVDTAARPTTPYFLRLPRDGDLYRWPSDARPVWGQPFQRADFNIDFALASKAAGRYPAGSREVAYRTNDQASGEVRRPVIIVPRVDVKLDPRSELWRVGDTTAHRFIVTLTHGGKDTTTGVVRLVTGAGWPAPEPQRFSLTHEDERQEFQFDVRLPSGASPGRAEFRAVAETAGGREYDLGVYLVDYPHIRARAYTQPAAAAVTVAALTLPRLARVGYVRGAADGVPEALADVGVPVEMLGRPALESGDLSAYDAIVVGPRAYETDTALVLNNARLIDYARNGGLVIVQYQQHFYFNGGFAPYPLTVGGRPLRLTADSAAGSGSRVVGPPVSHDRVTDETAAVSIIDSASPVVTTPNRLGAGDWQGWVQERGLYFARSWDAAYHPVFELHDPGEAPLEGGLLVAKVGKGTYVYTGLSFFRQLPAGVPGAFRLFANLLALGER